MNVKHHIILVDDDQNIRRFLDEFLKLKGFNVSSFSSAEEAFEELDKGDFSIAIFDIVLPGISGREACARLRKNKQTASRPVILMTAIHRGEDEVEKAKKEFGATEYLLKPFSLDTLYQKIMDLLGEEYKVSDLKDRETATIEGELKDTQFPKLLHDLYALKATGLLHLSMNERKKVVYFMEGYPIFVRSNLIRECLGKLLVHKGIIDERECEESLKMVKETGRLQGTVLIEMGYLTPQQLHDVLKLQATEKLLEVFSWNEGTYRFIHAQDFKKNITRINLSPATLTLQGLRKYYSEEKLDKFLNPHLSYYPALSTNPHYRFQDIELTPKDVSLLSECRGDKTFEEILEKYPLSRFENKQLLATLLLVKMLESREMPLSPEEQSTLLAGAPEKKEKRQKFQNDYARMMQQDYFALLGVEHQASTDNVRKAYVQLAKKYHPDRYLQENISNDLKKKINSLFQRIGEAYETLSNPARKNEYLKELTGKGKKKENEAADILHAETAFQKGLVLLKVNDFAKAKIELEKAVKLYAKEPEYLCHLAWARFKDSDSDVEKDQAKKMLLKAIQMNPDMDKGHFYLGHMLKEEGKEREAEKRFERAIQCNPDNTEALRELRLFQMRKPRNGKAAALLGKMFKK
ncbi:MAG: hypothetical protein C0623_04065 [Desulfuromonas sp.]|nr:MAG: hypothetical protein C0623_04065 [Desulfuromonas sp.]